MLLEKLLVAHLVITFHIFHAAVGFIRLYEIFNDSNIVNYIKVKTLAWAGHLMRMSDNRTKKKYLTLNWMA
jgi:hypothetical protein